MRLAFALCSGLVFLSACQGKSAKPTASSGTVGASSVPSDGAQSAAITTQPDIDCSRVKPQSTPAGKPVDDVLGVRSGMSPAQAHDVLLCSNKSYSFGSSTSAFDQYGAVAMTSRYGVPRLLKGQNPIAGIEAQLLQPKPKSYEEMRRTDMLDNNSTDTVAVSFVGLRGVEGVSRVARDYMTSRTEPPSMESVIDGLVKKYGVPQFSRTDNSPAQLIWVYQTDGQPMDGVDPRFNDCANAAIAEFNVKLADGCGVVINANIFSGYGDTRAARELKLSVEDQAYARSILSRELPAVEAMNAPAGSPPKL